MWVLGIEPGSSRKAASALTAEPFLQPICLHSQTGSFQKNKLEACTFSQGTNSVCSIRGTHCMKTAIGTLPDQTLIEKERRGALGVKATRLVKFNVQCPHTNPADFTAHETRRCGLQSDQLGGKGRKGILLIMQSITSEKLSRYKRYLILHTKCI